VDSKPALLFSGRRLRADSGRSPDSEQSTLNDPEPTFVS